MNNTQIEFIFNLLDKDKSGYLSPDEFCEGLIEFYHITDDKKESYREIFNDIFLLADGKGLFNSKDNKITLREFKNICSLLPTETKKTDVIIGTVAFRLVDSNNSGKVNKKELTAFLKKTGVHLKKGEIDALMDSIDEDGDGKISFQEFMLLYDLN
ncbi:EF-hand calcium-binding domain containing protein [Entamoeba histolytica HM-1:IMSS-B]|uniref:EF-hand calcium-binding domain containing protein n=6 Tax=Entamoeba histolytica TaxID=5759 RepID=C4M6I6_ENTH1|nr:EF-hand calcium-binding domain containing protein [Entamoeba histolytica HM-1:IMSS]EMD44238.1 EF hand calcium-binding domain containing protein [Entamoeba histolytica KU27]EMH75756.1 EF-hand calcium-binding domain containing protein [Entamoeba histolytica HM-1:IMSS-B]EMS16400.1 EF-hand calcium-binding domain containing protein [Entamoeba histolytica HM-3:IMSS]ENY64570.1 EF-hand calcium-binding domain containing protein [Entamoeba histolytica HM-1:IMSS-A]GAT97100.1 EF-hand calcium-binding do|eukprot:XP_649138.1 EF-hand calcium-binding domain containing protein [Entamoeba histolytica HM-1:IMSS]